MVNETTATLCKACNGTGVIFDIDCPTCNPGGYNGSGRWDEYNLKGPANKNLPCWRFIQSYQHATGEGPCMRCDLTKEAHRSQRGSHI